MDENNTTMIEEKTENKSTEKDKDKTTILPFFGFPRLFPYMKKYRGKIIFMIIIGGVVSFIDTLLSL